MIRYKLTLEYDGRAFVGWQRQANGASVQAALEEAVLRFCGETVTAIAAGRTDAGVHALGQVAQIDLAGEIATDKLRDAINFHLKPLPVAVIRAELAPEGFHARFSASLRRYRYRILNRRAPLVLDAGRAWRVPQPLDAEAMHKAAQHLVGRHDFTSFRATLCQAPSPVKTLNRLSVERMDEEITILAEARSFLHHQVRNMVGSVKLVGEGRWSEAQLVRVLEACDRRAAGPTAPAFGLYLIEVRY
jgi:tRNA pseudouridine38-40 synthase